MTPRRVATANATIPPPSDALFWLMAREICTAWSFDYDKGCGDDWDATPQEAKDDWFNAARAAYAVIAERGGGKVTPIGAKP